MDTERKKPEVTTSIILDTWVTNKEGKHPVKLRITYQRQRKYYTIKNQHCTANEYALIMDDRSRGKNRERRRIFESVENRAIDIIDNVMKTFTFESFEKEYKTARVTTSSLESYFESKINEIDKIQTASLYQATLNSLLMFDKRISFHKITPMYLKKYEKWMLERNNSYTTIGMYLRNLRHIIKLAINNGDAIDYPFGNGKGLYHIPSSRNIKKALSLRDIGVLFNYEPENRNEVLALNYWLFSYLCNGMNMIDIAYLRFRNIRGNNIEFVRQKTKDTSQEVPVINILLRPQIIEIMKKIGSKDTGPDEYIFNIFKPGDTDLEKHARLKQHIKTTNKYIKRIASKTGLNENITTYWARHTYSTVLKRSGTPVEFISEQLGHQSIKVTQNYLDSFENEQREKYSDLLIPKNSNDSV